MRYALAVSINRMTPEQTEEFIREKRSDLIGNNSFIEGIRLDDSNEIQNIHRLDANDIKKVKMSLIWNLCFTDEVPYFGAFSEKIPQDVFDSFETNLTFAGIEVPEYDWPNMTGEERFAAMDSLPETLWAVIDPAYSDDLLAASKENEDYFLREDRSRFTKCVKALADMADRVKDDKDLRLAYFFDF